MCYLGASDGWWGPTKMNECLSFVPAVGELVQDRIWSKNKPKGLGEKAAEVGNDALMVHEGIESWVEEMQDELENKEIQLKQTTLKPETHYHKMGEMVEELGQKVGHKAAF